MRSLFGCVSRIIGKENAIQLQIGVSIITFQYIEKYSQDSENNGYFGLNNICISRRENPKLINKKIFLLIN